MTSTLVWLLAPSAAAATIAGTLENTDGMALNDVAVQVIDQHLRGAELRSDGDGHFAFSGLPPGRYRLRALPDHGRDEVWRYHPQVTTFCEGSVFDVIDEDDVFDNIVLALPSGSTLTGRLVDDGGTGLAGMTVWAISPNDESASRLRAGFTDSDGAFAIRGLDVASGLPSWAVGVAGEGWPEQYLGAVYEEDEGTLHNPEVRGTLDIGEHALLRGISVSGSVSSKGEPVTVGTVHVYAGGQVQSVPIQGDSTYLAAGLPPGDILPWVSAPGLALTYWPDHDRPTTFGSATEEGEAVTGMDLDAPPEATVRITLIDEATGTGIAEAGGLLYNDTQTVGLGAQADTDGVLEILGMYGGPWFVFVWASEQGYADGFLLDDAGEQLLIDVIPEEKDQEFVLAVPKASVISGRVIDENGLPINNAAIVALRADGSGEAERSDEDGTFAIGGLGADAWQLWAEHTPYCPQDPSYVTQYWGDTVNPDWQELLPLGAGERIDNIELVLQIDVDQDEMGDTWERAHNLDPTRNDAYEDPDGDEYTNLDEFRLGTDPQEGSPTLSCGCGASSVAWLLLLPAPLLRRRR